MSAIKQIDYRKLDPRQTIRPKEANEDFYANRAKKGILSFLSGLDKKTKIELIVLPVVCVLAVAVFVLYFTQFKP